MNKLIRSFPKQLTEAIEIGQKAKLSKSANEIRNVVVSGLGGSGIGGSLVKELLADDLKIPFEVNKGYFLPNYVNKNTLVIISSYSGNTEETVNVMFQAMKSGAKISCVTSGGKVGELAQQYSLDVISIPGGMPPRACLGYSFTQQLFILKFHELIKWEFVEELNSAIQLLEKEMTEIEEKALKIAHSLDGKYPVIYANDEMESVAVRWRQQINENSKMLCWHHIIPEMNHNELVGWRSEDDNLGVVLLRNDDDYKRVQQRLEINKTVFSTYTKTVLEINSKGKNKTEKALYLIHFGDWVSWHLAQIRNIDAVEVKVIDHLKAELAKLN